MEYQDENGSEILQIVDLPACWWHCSRGFGVGLRRCSGRRSYSTGISIPSLGSCLVLGILPSTGCWGASCHFLQEDIDLIVFCGLWLLGLEKRGNIWGRSKGHTQQTKQCEPESSYYNPRTREHEYITMRRRRGMQALILHFGLPT